MTTFICRRVQVQRKRGYLIYYKQEHGCRESCFLSRRAVGGAGVAGWWRVGPLLYHLVPLLADGVKPLVLRGGGGEEEESAEQDETENERLFSLCYAPPSAC